MEIDERLEALRREMEREGAEAYIIFGTDPHLSEYVAPRWRDREWLSGFSGSAGTLVVTAEDAVLFTDPRYHLQAGRELEGTPFRLVKDGLHDSPTLSSLISSMLGAEETAAASAWTISLAFRRELETELAENGIRFKTSEDLIERVWEDRPGYPNEWIYQHDVSYTGLSRKAKFSLVREALNRRGGTFQLISSLDDIAWLFNLRGNDIAYNPLFLSFAMVGAEKSLLFVNEEKISDDLASLLADDGVELRPYDELLSTVSHLTEGSSIVLSPEKTSCAVVSAVPEGCRIIEKEDVTTFLKARKNEVECNGIREAMRKDGVAMVRFLSWLGHAWERGGEDELSIGEQLGDFRSQMPGFMGESFGSIVAFRDHGAVMHYSASPESAYRIEGPGLLLIDSGGHYLEGTTDITRVLPFGEVSEQQRSDYTAVLKAHIALASMTFPEGSNGMQIDAVARKPMWDLGLNYGHGTGHGVGFFLNVHEGPQKISYRYVKAVLEAGMVNSNEPGLYREGQYGIRLENLVLTKEAFSTPFGNFFGFETLTLCPFERELIDTRMLGGREIEWIDAYHRHVRESLSPELGETDRRWLEQKTAALLDGATS